MNSKLAIAATTFIAAFAAGANEYTESTNLDSVVECSELVLGGECNLDLNGHDLTFRGPANDFVPTSGAMIRNSGAAATVIIEATSGKWNQQFQNVQFAGNLKLVVKGETSSNAGFQGVHNSHTLGTLLDSYGTDDNATQPRFNTGDAFGTGPLTLNNGTYIHLTGSGITPSWFSINVSEGKGTIVNDQAITVSEQNNKIVVAEGATFSFAGNKQIKIYEWDTTGIAGTLEAATRDQFLLIDKTGFANGTLSIATEVRYRANEETDGAEIPISRLEGVGVLKHVKETLDDTAITLVISSGDFSGQIVLDSNGGDWNLRKTGDGELVLSGNNSYAGTTSIDAGKLTLKGENARLSATSSISFAGGTLAYAEGATQNLAQRIKSGTHSSPIHVDVGSGTTVTYNTNGNNLETAAKEYGFIKDGEGTLYLNYRHKLVVPTIVNGGEFKMQFWKGIVKSDTITEENNRIYIADGATLTLDNGDVDGTPNLGTPVYGSGTLRVGQGKGKTFRFNNATDFANFTGTLDFIGSAYSETASGLMENVDGLANTTLVASYDNGDSTSPAKAFDIEMKYTKTIGALQVRGNSTYIHVKNGVTLNVGEKSGSETILNGYFTGSSSLRINKNGQTPITLGGGFTMPSGARLNINAASKLIVNTDITAELPYTLTIASSIPTISGTGTVSESIFASAGTYEVKATDGGLTVDGTVNFASVNIGLDLNGVDPSDKGKTYSLLTAKAMEGGIPAAWSEMLSALNEGATKGKWKLRRVNNGDGTVTLKCAFAKSGFVVVFR